METLVLPIPHPETLEDCLTNEASNAKRSDVNRKHPTRSLRILDHDVLVDIGIYDLIVLLNKVDGLNTLFSCQGDFGGRISDCAYVLLIGTNSLRFALKWLRSAGDMFHFTMSYSSYWNSWTIHWRSRDYSEVYNAAIKAAKAINSL